MLKIILSVPCSMLIMMDMMMIMMMMEEMVIMQGITNSFQILMSSGSVTDAFRLEIAIASPSFVSLLQC